ncbi:histidine phosphatase family protein [Niastella caeni]|uniref:Histidine phosphatase family protein n=1 Tax=Niastella caeni TaxID=2569763 RepID=A0A4S8HNP8_9BACT|nr:histidine phosphatase family protein [Niastella caeni]THU36957.1 histidine phosphatase family protein [Niastella caeni]
MKSVIIIRHAKSSWDHIGVDDFDRPLNERGKEDAPRMAKRLLERNVTIDAFISSSAKRARKTAAIFIKEFGGGKDDVLLLPELYLAGPDAFYNAIAQAPSSANTIALFAHNPGITDFANELTDVRIDDMPTCAIFAVKADIQNWSQFRDAEKQYWFFDYPKAKLG